MTVVTAFVKMLYRKLCPTRAAAHHSNRHLSKTSNSLFWPLIEGLKTLRLSVHDVEEHNEGKFFNANKEDDVMSDLHSGWVRKSRFDYEPMSAIIDPQRRTVVLRTTFCYHRDTVIDLASLH